MITNKNTLNPVSYTGVGADNPPNLTIQKRDPTNSDYKNFSINTLWWSKGLGKLWMLVDNTPSSTTKWVRLYPVGTGGASEFDSDSGNALSYNDIISIVGGNNIHTNASSNIVSVSLDDDVIIPNSLQVNTLGAGVVVSDSSGLVSSALAPSGVDAELYALTGNVSVAPSFKKLVSEDSSVTISVGTAPNTINLEAVGGGGGGNFAGLIGDNAVTATPSLDKVSVLGDGLSADVSNISTVASGHKINISHSNLLNLGVTTSNGRSGVIKLNGDIYFSALGTDNLFLGKNSGSLSLNVVSAQRNIGLGCYALSDLDTSVNNVAIGVLSLNSLDSGAGGNVCIGYESGTSIQTGSRNVLIGYLAGKDYSSNESKNIIIGDWTGIPGEQNSTSIGNDGTSDCYIKGIYESSGLDTTNGVVQIDQFGKLVSSKGTVGQVLTSTATGVEWQGGSSASHYGFYAYQDGNSEYILTGTNYILGTKAVFVTQVNEGSAFFIGDGTSVPASYTALASGLYSFNCTLYMGFQGTESYVNQWRGLFMHTPSQDFFQSFITAYSSSSLSSVFTFNFVTPLTIGDVVTWEIQNKGYYPGCTMSIYGKATGGNDGVGTSLSGYLIG